MNSFAHSYSSYRILIFQTPVQPIKKNGGYAPDNGQWLTKWFVSIYRYALATNSSYQPNQYYRVVSQINYIIAGNDTVLKTEKS